MAAGVQSHWDGIYDTRPEEELTWFEAIPLQSWALVRQHLRPGEAFIDIGGGMSRLVDFLLKEEFGPLAVLDVSTVALAVCRDRLGKCGDEVTWIAADVTSWQPDKPYTVWHDRAVFHFLTERADRAAYARVMLEALHPGGIAIISTFADDGPEMCSGLPVVRYAPGALARELDGLIPRKLELVEAKRRMHVTPKGNQQSFQYSVFRKVSEAA